MSFMSQIRRAPAQSSRSSDEVVVENFPECDFGGYTRYDGTVEFYTRIASILKSTDHVLDFGAGRGCGLEDPSAYRRSLRQLRGRCAHVEGCDVDRAVFQNPLLDGASLVQDGALQYPDASFDLIIADWVFEHIETPESVIPELMRVLKPGGCIFARTPNKWGYVSFAARFLPGSLLKYIQPERLDEDVFPKCYEMNSKRQLDRLFNDNATIVVHTMKTEPTYFFGSNLVFRMMKALHELTPSPFQPFLMVMIRKN